MDSGELTLNESLEAFEDAVKLVRFCTAELDQAEQKVVKLKKGADRAPVELPFEDEE